MAIIRQKRNNKFSILSNEMLDDTNMSFKARGLLAYMLSKPDDWKFYVSELTDHSSKDGEKAIRSALSEIESAGYLERHRDRDDTGKFTGQDFILSDKPHSQNRHDANRPDEKRPDDKGRLLSTDSTKNLNKPSTDNKKQYSAVKNTAHSAKAEPHIPYKEIINYLNQKAGTHYRNTKTNQRIIEPRFKEGATLDDCKHAIDVCVSNWKGTNYEKYLRPSTIFRASKFEGYVNSKPDKKQARSNSYSGESDPHAYDQLPW